MPASIFLRTILQTSSYMPGGIGIFFSTQGVCGTTGKSIGGKKSVLKLPRSESSQAKPSFCLHMKSCSNARSSGRRKSPVYIVRMVGKVEGLDLELAYL